MRLPPPPPRKPATTLSAIGLHSSSSSCPARRFYVPSRDDVAESMGEGDDDDDDDGDDIAMILDKLRRSDEDEEDEQTLQEWMRTQQEAARKTWGVKGDVASLAQYRRRQLLRYGHAQHVFDDEMSDEWNEHQVPGPASTSQPRTQPPKHQSCRQPSPQTPPNRLLTDALGLWLQASLLVGGRLHDATQRRELVAALGSPSDDGAITRFFDPVYPSSALSRLPDDLLREDGDEIARSRESSVDQFDVFVDALDRRVGRAFSQLETLFMPERESSTSSRAAVSGRTRF